MNPQRIADFVDAEGLQLVTRATSEDRASRPAAKELYRYFRDLAMAHVTPPEITMVRLATPVVQVGQQGWVDWRIKGAGEVTVTTGTDVVARVDADDHPHGCAFRPPAAGPVHVAVTNPFGKAVAEAGYVVLFEPPSVSITRDNVPALTLPAVEAVSLEPLADAFTSGPDPGRLVPAIPALPAPSIAGVLGELVPGGVPEILSPLAADSTFGGLLSAQAPVVPWPDFQGALIDTASAVSARIRRAAERAVLMEPEHDD